MYYIDVYSVYIIYIGLLKSGAAGGTLLGARGARATAPTKRERQRQSQGAVQGWKPEKCGNFMAEFHPPYPLVMTNIAMENHYD